MHAHRHSTLRTRAAGFLRWLLGQDTIQQRTQREQTLPNGVIRQQHDPDYALAQREREQREAQRRSEDQRRGQGYGR